jgi:hypothetical protein
MLRVAPDRLRKVSLVASVEICELRFPRFLHGGSGTNFDALTLGVADMSAGSLDPSFLIYAWARSARKPDG